MALIEIAAGIMTVANWVLRTASDIVGMMAGFFGLFPGWAQAMLVSGVFFYDATIEIPAIGKGSLGKLIGSLTGFFGFPIDSMVLAVGFFAMGLVVLLLSVQNYFKK